MTSSPDLSLLPPRRGGRWPFSQDACMACSICACACPVSGVDGFDPRKVVRLAAMGLEQELVDSRWPWICTMCGKCENACPMDVRIADVVRRIRSLRDRDQVPGILHKGLQAALEAGSSWRTWPGRSAKNPGSKGCR